MEDLIHRLREELGRACMAEALAEEQRDHEAMRFHRAEVDRIRAALTALGQQGYPPLDPQPWPALEALAERLENTYSPDDPDAPARADLALPSEALAGALRALAPFRDEAAAGAVHCLCEALAKVIQGIQGDARHLAGDARELAAELDNLVGGD